MIQKIKISKLIPNEGQIEGLPSNPREITEDKLEYLKKSLIENPEMLELRELIAYPLDDKFVVIAGNMRLQAAIELKYKELSCKVLPKETSIEQLQAYTIKDNLSYGKTDWDKIANEWDAKMLIEFGMDLPVDFDDNLDDFFDDEQQPPKEKEKLCPHCGKDIYKNASDYEDNSDNQ